MDKKEMNKKVAQKMLAPQHSLFVCLSLFVVLLSLFVAHLLNSFSLCRFDFSPLQSTFFVVQF